MVTDDEKWIEEAILLAREAMADGELSFGAVIVRDGVIVSTGRCRESKLKTVLAHAESEAVNSACIKLATNNLSGSVIYCTNEPCIMCAAAIFQAKISKVVIGVSRSDIPRLRPRKINIDALAKDSGYVIQIVRGIKKDKILSLFTDNGS